MPMKRSRVIGSPCADCSSPITEELAVWRSGARSGHLMSYCRTCYRLRRNKSQQKNPARNAERQREWYNRLRVQILKAYGHACACCGESIAEFLALDHVDGGGTKHRRRRAQSGVYVDVVRQGFPDTYRLLCHNCNQAFGAYGRCPHANA